MDLNSAGKVTHLNEEDETVQVYVASTNLIQVFPVEDFTFVPRIGDTVIVVSHNGKTIINFTESADDTGGTTIVIDAPLVRPERPEKPQRPTMPPEPTVQSEKPSEPLPQQQPVQTQMSTVPQGTPITENVYMPGQYHPQQIVYIQTGKKNPVNKVGYIVLALLLGGFGVHKFYEMKIGRGVLYLLFCWTMIPTVISLIEGLVAATRPADVQGNIYL